MRLLFLLSFLFLTACGSDSAKVAQEINCNEGTYLPACSEDGSNCINRCGEKIGFFACQVDMKEYNPLSVKIFTMGHFLKSGALCDKVYLSNNLKVMIKSGMKTEQEIMELVYE